MRFLSLLLLLGMVACQPSNKQKQNESTYTDKDLGQLIIVGFRGTEISKESAIVKDIKERNIGGFILTDFDASTQTSGRNVKDAMQLLKLSSALVGYSSNPPIIALNQEGGEVSPLNAYSGSPKTVSAKYLGQIDKEDSTRLYSQNMAQEFMVVGVNTNFAPVLDLDINKENHSISKKGRSFSARPEKVTEHVGYFLDEFDKEGILTVLKHFPGLGSAQTNPHDGIVDVTDTWDPKELIPYKNLFAERNINGVMASHIYNAQLDSVWPATFSDKTINGLLRDSLGFNGVVFSDDLQLQYIQDKYGLETAIAQALNAGIDMLIFGNNEYYDEQIAEKVITILQKLVAEGTVSTETIDAALQRVAKLKQDVIAELCTCLN